MIDLSTPFGERVARRLQDEYIIWITTVRKDGTPQPSPVWFLWDGATLLIYSKANTQKLRNIEQQPIVSLNFDGDGKGGDIVVFTGTAQVDEAAPPSDQIAAYQAKYAQGIAGIGMTPATFAETYGVALRVTPTALRGH